jgi:hypothetical protein
MFRIVPGPGPESIATLTPFDPIEGHTVSGFSRFPANESLGRSGLHSSLSAKFSFYLLYLHLRSPVHVVPPLVIDVLFFFLILPPSCN